MISWMLCEKCDNWTTKHERFQMSGYTSGNNAPTQMAQSPNRKGNVSKHTPTGMGGVTAQPKPQGSTAYGKGHVGPASANGKVNGRNQPVQVSRPKADYCCNDGYMKNSSYLK
jgi:hypothetical protein